MAKSELVTAIRALTAERDLPMDVIIDAVQNALAATYKRQYGPTPDVTVRLDTETGEFKLNPAVTDLLGFEESVRALSELLSYRYPNALIPLVLANSTVSIARQPSGGILQAFADHLMAGNPAS